MAAINILAFSGEYLPGYKGGGPIRTLANMVDHLGEDFSFHIIAGDRDLGDLDPYPGVITDSWQTVGKARVYYLSSENRSMKALGELINSTPHDIIYLSSFFSPVFTIKPLILRRRGLIPRVPLLIAPRGQFSSGAMKIKMRKKLFYLTLSKRLGLFKQVVWQASSPYEKEDILRCMGSSVNIWVAPDLPLLPPTGVDSRREGESPREKAPGLLKVIFLSRVSPMKNLKGALEILKDTDGKIQLDIVGPLEDQDYWGECQKIIRGMPENITVGYKGTLPHDQVTSTFKEYHLFFLPTLGENFGHVILESLAAGCPVLISDRTLWRDLEKNGVGWALPLENPGLFREALETMVAMEGKTHRQMSQRAVEYGLRFCRDESILEKNRQLFIQCLG
ncbi:glycosyltransferase family 4 protein [Candidatus Contubernalis alkaliaceticus]|uniref:glycosyltransferase family 4 protein n=1 Tax=Candidatus Contubernalis alkaliaceticus TaxID=338645 RepID=UPI001F4BD759|nr:glycosyltransferase family 4 protein [Candidatus Contubernalis alkalaceticus]UNC93623.1 glycosyltransferase family 4 protein [Candidatus Contubernalis alkalaceticus]